MQGRYTEAPDGDRSPAGAAREGEEHLLIHRRGQEDRLRLGARTDALGRDRNGVPGRSPHYGRGRTPVLRRGYQEGARAQRDRQGRLRRHRHGHLPERDRGEAGDQRGHGGQVPQEARVHVSDHEIGPLRFEMAVRTRGVSRGR